MCTRKDSFIGLYIKEKIKVVFEKMKRKFVGLIIAVLMLVVPTVGCKQNISENQPILEKEVQLEALWGNIFIMEERVLDENGNLVVCAFADVNKRIGIAFFKKEKTGEYVLDSSTFLKGSVVSESRRIVDVNYIAYYSKESDVAYLEVTEDGKCEKHDINGLFILEKAVGEEVSVDIKYYED